MNRITTASARGKIILSGEYAVLFGKQGIAIPSELKMKITLEESQKNDGLTIVWNQKDIDSKWISYSQKIVERITKNVKPASGILTIDNALPLGKGMGSSTALIIALCRCIIGPDSAKIALTIENEMNPGHSGIDFAVIWEERPILFRKGLVPEVIMLPANLLAGNRLIDTGTPTEATPVLVAWVKEKYAAEEQQRKKGAGCLPTEAPQSEGGLPAVEKENQTIEAIETIGQCTERILAGEPIKTVMRDHHRAQVMLGVVPERAQTIIADIERSGGSAKIIGAGSRSGGGGMVLAI